MVVFLRTIMFILTIELFIVQCNRLKEATFLQSCVTHWKLCSLSCTRFFNNMLGSSRNMYMYIYIYICMYTLCNHINLKTESFIFHLPLIRGHHSYKNEQCAIQGCKNPSRKCTTYNWRIQPVFVQYNPISFERAGILQSMQWIFQTCACLFTLGQRYSTRFITESMVLFETHDLIKEWMSQVFMHKVMYSFPASILLFSGRQWWTLSFF